MPFVTHGGYISFAALVAIVCTFCIVHATATNGHSLDGGAEAVPHAQQHAQPRELQQQQQQQQRVMDRPQQRNLLQAPVAVVSTTTSSYEQHQAQNEQKKRAGRIALPLPTHYQSTLPDLAVVPADFDWQRYLSYNPDVLASGVITEEMAKVHFAVFGIKEKRLYKALRVTVRYNSCGGLINQHYCHIAALAVAAGLQAEGMMFPPALSRDSFANYFSSHPKHNEVHWAAKPADSIWDLNHTITYWHARGIKITPTPPSHPLPDFVHPRTAYPTWLPAGYNWTQVARLPDAYISRQNLTSLLATATRLLARAAVALPDHNTPLLLDLPCPLFMLDTSSAPSLVEDVARSLPFAPHMLHLANKVLSQLQEPRFNGLHLRMERDARDWAANLGGRDALLGMYLSACKEAGFSHEVPMYLATGLFSYKKGLAEQTSMLRSLQGVCNRVHTKEHYLTAEDTAGLSKEGLALVDFLVLARCQHFVGIGLSTFSFFLPQYRRMFLNAPLESSVLVSGGPKGRKSDILFHAAARVVGVL